MSIIRERIKRKGMRSYLHDFRPFVGPTVNCSIQIFVRDLHPLFAIGILHYPLVRL